MQSIIKLQDNYLFLTGILCLFLLNGCGSASNMLPKNFTPDHFTTSKPVTEVAYASPELLRDYDSQVYDEYRIGPGDQILITVWNRPELSGEHLIGPFGIVTLAMVGEYEISGQTRGEASRSIHELYSAFYETPKVAIKILKYLNNKVYVLGRVTNPGVIHFDGRGTLLEALSLAGGLPTRDDKTNFLSKCAIIRGNNQIIWVDLVKLLQEGNLKYNVMLRNNDIIHIPESTDAAVFVMGAVKNPGSYQIQTSGLKLLDALNLAGGPTEDANNSNIRIIRNMKEDNFRVVDLADITDRGDYSQNYLLKDDDVIYVPKKGIAKFNYYLRQVDPLVRMFIFGALF